MLKARSLMLEEIKVVEDVGRTPQAVLDTF